MLPDQRLEVILTHEHTDFDALASLMAASILFPEALPVLPRQLNRNVRSFLTLYRDSLPFVTDKDVPKGRVTRAILVDSDSVNWVKGMDENVEFLIIDHHSYESARTTSHKFWTDAVGANTTMLVEKLMARNFPVTPIQATLLALGIHEDTGSLTYPSTTHRDARALAWVLEPQHNVNMEVVAQFLNHPLTESQRLLLQELIDRSEFVHVAGHIVVIAQAEASGFSDEISALATRLRDFHETDAVFLIINLGDIVQLVARSTTDEIDVGKVAEALGGGGHRRAAAAPIHIDDVSVDEIRDRIVRAIHEHSRSAITVERIMSAGRPQSVAPEMTIQAAAELMRRYGHEGFPVLKQLPDGTDQVMGVLTRRETDRAISHDLGGEPVTRFMRAGSVTVHPSDSVSTLRRMMIDHNWGQVPVMDENNHVVGIVTRTDLIKLWDETALPGRHAGAVARRLEETLSPVQLALLRLVGREVEALDYTVYVVGGFVRDLMLNHRLHNFASLDLDVVIEGDAIEFARHTQKKYGGRIVPHRRFNTAKWLLDDEDHPLHRHALADALGLDEHDLQLPAHLDFVTARTEFYTAPTALPTVEDSSIKLDLHRRDFTINTLALCLNPDRWGELLDFYGGMNDLNEGVVRALHSLSFVDDPTRILRAVRYEQRFGFRIDRRTLELIFDAVDLLDRVSPTRIRHELERVFLEEMPEKTLIRLDALGILERIEPSLHMDGWIEQGYQLLRQRRSEEPTSLIAARPIELLYWGILVYRLPKSALDHLTERLALHATTQNVMAGLRELRRRLDELQQPTLLPSQVVAILDRIDETALALTPILLREHPIALEHTDRYRERWRYVQTEIDGHDLRDLGIKRGPIYSEILSALRTAKLDGEVATREDERALALSVARAAENVQ